MDLSVYKITDTAENPWFTGRYFTKYSYPFNPDLTPALDFAMGFISHHNSGDAETLFDGTYVDGDVMEKAVLEVEEFEKTPSVTLRYGLDDFPNFTKKLAELPLLQIEVANIYTHAATVITQAWPNVNYNFPQIHIDKIETEESEVWFAFEKRINNYRDGAFLVNEVDLEEEITYNRNIIQPLPYLLYLLQAGFADAGFTLMGDVLANSDIKKTLLYTDTDYFTSIAQESVDIIVMATEYDSIAVVPGNGGGHQAITIVRSHEITQPGKYRITGSVQYRYLALVDVSMRVKYRDTILAQWSGHTSFNIRSQKTWSVDVTFETLTDLNPDFITFEVYVGYDENDITLDFSINPVRLHDDSGEAVPSILNLNEVDLKRAVPDMTFGDLVKDTLERYKLDLTTKGTEIWMNYVATEIATRPVKDLSMYEKKFPKRTFSKGNSTLMKYEDVNSEEYTWAEVFQDSQGYSTSGFTKTDKTTEVIFKSLPLPLLYRNNLQTAHGFLQEKTKAMFVLYGGLSGGLNLVQNPAPLLVPALHLQYHQAWLASLINAVQYQWTFLAYTEKLQGLTSKSRVHAYGNIHLVKTLQKTEVRPDLYEVELTTVVL